MSVSPSTADDFIQLLRKSDLVEPRQLDPFLAAQPLAKTAKDQAKRCIDAELITAFQADQLLQGKSQGFDLGNYRILRPLGGGITGVVYLCDHRILKTRVALKVLSPELVQKDSKSLQRFRREARAASLMQHDNIVRTLDLDEDNGKHFLVLEYVEGLTLDELLRKQPVLHVRDVVGYMIQALSGLQHIADGGLVHRDVKPGNLLLDKQGCIKILDLGLARFTDERHDDITVQQGVGILGTVDFMSPEQSVQCGAVDHRADIYSMGATLYYLVTGKTPLPEGTVTSKILAAQFHAPTRMSHFRPEVDTKLEEIVGRMMAKDPARRYQQACEAIAALQAWEKQADRPVPPQQSAKPGHPAGNGQGNPNTVSGTSLRLTRPSGAIKISAPLMPRAPLAKTKAKPAASPVARAKTPAPMAEEVLEGEIYEDPSETIPVVNKQDTKRFPVLHKATPPQTLESWKVRLMVAVLLGCMLGVLMVVVKS